MALKVLNIIESAYRATLEEQDDTILWISTAMKAAGADLAVLLCGNAVNYAVSGQDASGLQFGSKRQTQPPKLDEDVTRLIERGVPTYLVEDDAVERGIEKADLVDGIQPIKRAGIPALLADYDQIWRW